MNRIQETTFTNGRLSLDASDQPKRTDSRLLSNDSKTQIIRRDDLAFLPVPPSTDTFQPIAHKELVDTIDEALALRRFQITRSEFAASPDGMKLFGLLEINASVDGVRFAIGLRNSNDKSMRLGMVAGYRVTVCDNMMFEGDFNPLLAKHTKGLDLIESVSMGVDRIHRGFAPLKQTIMTKRLVQLSDDEAKVLIYQAFLEKKFPISLIKSVHGNYFKPEWEDFRERTLWSLENAFTESFKTLAPLTQYKTTAKFGKFVNRLVNPIMSDKAEYPAETVKEIRPELAAALTNGGDW